MKNNYNQIIPKGISIMTLDDSTSTILTHYDKSNCKEVNNYLSIYEAIHIANDTFLSNGSLDDLSVEAKKGDIFIYLGENNFKKLLFRMRGRSMIVL